MGKENKFNKNIIFTIVFLIITGISWSQDFEFHSSYEYQHQPKFYWSFNNNDSIVNIPGYISIMIYNDRNELHDTININVTNVKDTSGVINLLNDGETTCYFQYSNQRGFIYMKPVSFICKYVQKGSLKSLEYLTTQNLVPVCEYKDIIQLSKEIKYTDLKTRIINFLDDNGFFINKDIGNELYSTILSNTITSPDLCDPTDDYCDKPIEERINIRELGILISIIKNLNTNLYVVEICPIVKSRCRKCSSDVKFMSLSNLSSPIVQKLHDKIVNYKNKLELIFRDGR